MGFHRIGNMEGEFLAVDIGRVDEAVSVNIHHTESFYRKQIWIAVYVGFITSEGADELSAEDAANCALDAYNRKMEEGGF